LERGILISAPLLDLPHSSQMPEVKRGRLKFGNEDTGTVALRPTWNTPPANFSLKSVGSSSLLFSSPKTVGTVQKERQEAYCPVCIIRNSWMSSAGSEGLGGGLRKSKRSLQMQLFCVQKYILSWPSCFSSGANTVYGITLYHSRFMLARAVFCMHLIKPISTASRHSDFYMMQLLERIQHAPMRLSAFFIDS
jgi:hypothetical protein